MEQVRVFISINFSREIKLKLTDFISGLRGKFPDVRWVSDENMHLTLKFLGEIPIGSLDKLYKGCEEAVSDISRFSFSCEGLGMFPNERSPRVLWLGIKNGGQELKNLALRIEETLDKQGFPAEKRDFKPHLTLGRVKTEGNSVRSIWSNLNPYHNFSLGEIEADKICVMKSVLGPGGAKHFVLKELNLAKF